ncbi:hypothetical protein TWF102_002752 [Orbilia oligospora]|uniref:F-box domain-containing protein n=1 Tax=Orbilia oligospora TaxID=2813651 RepID=A0A7C8NSI4_ORBOL|nr:hypothetical protein TWF102_002752 [Orbilia oligospora]
MSYLVQLAQRVPEVFLEILQFVPYGDLAALLQTCKTLQPACYRQLWSMVVFGYPDHGRPTCAINKLHSYQPWCPAYQIDRTPAILSGLLNFLRSDAVNIQDLGFQYTRGLWLNSSIFENCVAQEFCDTLEGIFDSGLDLRHLTILMEVEDDALVTKYFCLSKVTEFTFHTSNDRAWKTLGRNNGPTGILKVQSKINQLAGVLSRMRVPNFRDLGITREPPESVPGTTLLTFSGVVEKFTKNPFVGLQSLFLHVETDQFFDLAEDVCSDNSFTLGCVSVSGLRNFKIFGRSKLPIDLEDCIVRNNPNLDEDSIRHICRALTATKILWSSLPGQYTTGDDTTDSLNSKAVKEYSRTFVSAKVPSEIMIRSDIWMDIEEKARKGLISRIKLCTKYTSCQYSMGAIQSDEDSEYMKSRLDPQRITQLEDDFLEDTLKAMQEFSGLLSKHSFVAGDWESTALDIETAAHKSLNGMRRLLKGMVPK